MLTSRQIFRYAVPARTVTKKALVVSHIQQHQLNRCGDCGSAGSIGTRQLLCSDVRGIDQLRGRKYVDRYTTVSLSCQRSETCENQNNSRKQKLFSDADEKSAETEQRSHCPTDFQMVGPATGKARPCLTNGISNSADDWHEQNGGNAEPGGSATRTSRRRSSTNSLVIEHGHSELHPLLSPGQ